MGLLSRLLGDKKPAPSSTSPRPAAPVADTPAPTSHAAPAEEDTGEGLVDMFADDHARCDELWAACEAATEDQAAFVAAVEAFDTATRRHLQMEEDILFPAFEDATGMKGFGPPTIMRQEHEQMRGLLDAVLDAARAGDIDGALDQGDTLLMITQQHNVKEEQVLYPMAEDVLGATWPDLRDKLARY